MQPTFKDEVMLLGWSETHTGGAKITLQLPDSEALEPFKSMTVAKGKLAGQRLACVLVEIGDDEQPKEPKPSRKHSQWLSMRINEESFRRWIFIEFGGNKNYTEDFFGADALVKQVLGISSKTEIDDDPEIEKLFIEKIINGWRDWNELDSGYAA